VGILEAFARVYYQDSTGRHTALPAALSTVYHRRFSDRYSHHSRSSIVRSTHAIIRLVSIAGIPWLDARRTCRANADHAHPMEPSVGSRVKIAYVISTLAWEHNFNHSRPGVYV
jgi:hypothetical protein